MRTYVAGAIFLGLLMAGLAFSQNAQLGGIVTDPSGGLVPGVTITATNTETGVVSSTITRPVPHRCRLQQALSQYRQGKFR